MLQLRPYEASDAEKIVGWLKDEVSFRQWCADRYEKYPITAEDMNEYYERYAREDNLYALTAVDEDGVAGHLTMRFLDREKKAVHFGFIIVDSSKRGKGYGKQMLKLAVQYAHEALEAGKITLGVFENNAHFGDSPGIWPKITLLHAIDQILTSKLWNDKQNVPIA